MVEMAIMMVILMTILSAVMDLGRGFFVFIAIQNSAAEGALYAAMYPLCETSADCADPDNVTYRAQHESSDGLVDATRMTVTVTYNSVTEGSPVTVKIGYRFRMIGPFSGVFPNGELWFEARATQNILDLKQ